MKIIYFCEIKRTNYFWRSKWTGRNLWKTHLPERFKHPRFLAGTPCPSPASPSYGSFSPSKSSWQPGDYVTYRCAPGYAL